MNKSNNITIMEEKEVYREEIHKQMKRQVIRGKIKALDYTEIKEVSQEREKHRIICKIVASNNEYHRYFEIIVYTLL